MAPAARPSRPARPDRSPSIWLEAPAATAGKLSRAAIVRAAIAVADDGGESALTMGAVARRLGPYTAMALYRHVPNKDGLIDLMLDHVVAEIPLPERPGPSWRGDLHALAMATWATITEHRWFATLVHRRPPLGPNMMRRTETILEILTTAGAPVADAMTYAALLDRHVFGAALQDAEERAVQTGQGIANLDELTAAIVSLRNRADPDRYPILATWMADPNAATPGDQLELSLTFLLDGIAARLPVPPAKAKRRAR